jgi:hypothetical protein
LFLPFFAQVVNHTFFWESMSPNGGGKPTGKLAEAIDLLESNGAGKARRNPAERHLRQWYLLGDLYDRSGDAPRARAFFTMVAVTDPGAYDVSDRLKDLGPTRKPRTRKPKGDAKT